MLCTLFILVYKGSAKLGSKSIWKKGNLVRKEDVPILSLSSSICKVDWPGLWRR